MQKQREIKEINNLRVNSQVASITRGADIANGSIDEKKGRRRAKQPPIHSPTPNKKGGKKFGLRSGKLHTVNERIRFEL